jgi:hypothetical protein
MEISIKLKSGVISSYSSDQKFAAEQYIRCLFSEEIAFSVEFHQKENCANALLPAETKV